jgi:hypothetical protein
MILPNVRASFGRSEAAFVVWLLARSDESTRARLEEQLRDDGFDAILDDPVTFNRLLSYPGLSTAPPRLVFYVLVRHALLEGGITDRLLADYLAALLLNFGVGDRARRLDDDTTQRFDYLVDIVQSIANADARRAFLLHAHLGNFALWTSGLFPDYINARVQRRGAPGIDYYEELGATGYQRAADSRDASKHGLDALFRSCAFGFPTLRLALNRVSDRYIFPRTGDPMDRLLRQVGDDFRVKHSGN